MVDKLQNYQGTVGQWHTLKDNIAARLETWKEQRANAMGTLGMQHEQPTHDFSHIHRKKTQWELMRITLGIVGIEFTYSAITAFVSPRLLEIGISHRAMTLVWAISPLLGLVLSPIMGSLSDRCKLPMGRRRPFIVLLSIFEIMGLILIPNGNYISKIFQDTPSSPSDVVQNDHKHVSTFGIVLTIIGVALADFCADGLQSPLRAYLLDVTNSEDHSRGLSLFTVMAGGGGAIGYVLGAIDWDHSSIGNLLGGHIRAVFTMVTILFIMCIALSISSFKEMPLDQVQENEYQLLMIGRKENDDNINNKGEDDEEDENESQGNKRQSLLPELSQDIQLPSSKATTPKLRDYLTSIMTMPRSLQFLCLTNLLCWMSHTCYSLFFTDYVGEHIFHGDPTGAAGSNEVILFNGGLRFACLGMAVYAIFCSLTSMFIETLILSFGLKKVYVGSILCDSFAQLCMYLMTNKVAVIFTSGACGIFYSSMLTLPYMLVARYHTLNVFEVDSDGNFIECNQIRGLGTDLALVGSCVFVAQFILSTLVGNLISSLGSISLIPLVCSFVALCASITATKVTYLDL